VVEAPRAPLSSTRYFQPLSEGERGFDYHDSLRLGDQVAIGILAEQALYGRFSVTG